MKIHSCCRPVTVPVVQHPPRPRCYHSTRQLYKQGYPQSILSQKLVNPPRLSIWTSADSGPKCDPIRPV